MTMVTVLGGTGKTGSRVAANLRVRGVEVRAVSRSTAVPFDWSHEAPWPAVLEGANAIYVIVDESPHGVDRLGRFLDLSNARGVQRIVLLSARDWIDAASCTRPGTAGVPSSTRATLPASPMLC